MNTLIQDIIDDQLSEEHPYFCALQDESFSHADFVETQIQFYSAVCFFNRPMAILAAKIPDPKLRSPIIQNIWEEHGEGQVSHQHGQTFLTLLTRLAGITANDIAKCPLWPEVDQFNLTLIGVCTMEPPVVAAGTLGIIEHMFSDISVRIGQGIINREWLPEDKLTHYQRHAVVDQRHAEDLLAVLRPHWPDRAPDITRGLRLGAHAFSALYRGLYHARGRRWRAP